MTYTSLEFLLGYLTSTLKSADTLHNYISSVEKSLKNAVESGKVSWKEYRVPTGVVEYGKND